MRKTCGSAIARLLYVVFEMNGRWHEIWWVEHSFLRVFRTVGRGNGQKWCQCELSDHSLLSVSALWNNLVNFDFERFRGVQFQIDLTEEPAPVVAGRGTTLV